MAAKRKRSGAELSKSLASILVGASVLFGAGCGGEGGARSELSRPHILLLVADDLGWDSVGAYGCSVPGTTPHIDELASQGVRFERAYLNASVCQPSRNVLLSGRYGHRSGGEGFGQLRVAGLPLLPTVLRDAGYRVGVMGKLQHSTPYGGSSWDHAVDRAELGMGRSPSLFAQEAEAFMRAALEARQPFFLMANSHDPHRPFNGFEREAWRTGTKPVSAPSRTFAPEECPLPAYLPALPMVRREVAAYYDSVRRCDDTMGALLATLEQLDLVEETLVVFLSDNGPAFPFAKASCYPNGIRTPLVLRWPGHLDRSVVVDDGLVSAVDLMPTVLEAAGVELPAGLDGRSFWPMCLGQDQGQRELVFAQYGRAASGAPYPMRAVQGPRFGYVFNPWSDGAREFVREEHQANGTYRAMQQAAASEPAIAARVAHLARRRVEELYDYEVDPHALNNLIDDPAHAGELERLRGELEAWMVRCEDPVLGAFRERESPAALRSFMDELELSHGDR